MDFNNEEIGAGKRAAEDEHVKQVAAKKQKIECFAENQKKESNSDDLFSDSANSDENSGLNHVTTSSKKLLAASAIDNNISKVESSNDSSHDIGLDEDNKLLSSAVEQSEGIENTDISHDASREGFDRCNVSEENEIKEKPSTTHQKDMKDDEMVDATSTGESGKEVSKTVFTPAKPKAASKKIFVGNLSYEVKRANLENLFKHCGEIVDVNFGLYRDGTFRGFAHVEFATEEAAHNALMMSGTELLRRFIRIEMAHDKFANIPNSSCMNCNNSLKGFQSSFGGDEPTTPATSKEQNATSRVLFVGNLSYSVEKDDLENLFQDCGEIVDIRFATDREGRFKGFAHVSFATEEAAEIALMLNGKDLLRRSLRLNLAPERGAYSRSSKNESFQEDTSLGGNEAKIPAAPKEQNAASKTVFVGNLSYSVEKADLENLFKDCGEILDIRLATDREGRFKGFGHVDFATLEAAQNALKVNGHELLRRYLNINLANEKIVHSSNGSVCGNRDDSGNVGSQTVFVRGFDTSLREDEIRNSLEEHFKSCGKISRISIARDHDTGSTKGFAWIDFMDVDGFKKALELDGTEVVGYVLSVEKRKPRRHTQDGRGGGDQLGGGRRGGDQPGGGWRGGEQLGGGWRGGDQLGGGWHGGNQVSGGWHGGNQLGGGWRGGSQIGIPRSGDRFGGGWHGGDQSGGWHGSGQWDHGRSYGRRWH